MKKCSQCDLEKDSTEFGSYPRSADGLSYQCKTCISENRRKTRETNKANAGQNQLKYKDVDKVCSSCKMSKDRKEFYKNSTTFDGYNAQCKSCSDETKRTVINKYANVIVDPQSQKQCSKCGDVKTRSKFQPNKWQKDGVNSWCKDCVTVHAATIESQIRMMLTRARSRAKKNDLLFNVDYEYVVGLLSPSIEHPICPVFGFKMEWKIAKDPNNHQKNKRPSLDRIDNDKGYIKGNVAVISMKANNMKRAYTRDEFMMLVDWLDSLSD